MKRAHSSSEGSEKQKELAESLHQIHAGEVTVEEAARRMANREDACDGRAEAVRISELIDRLGPPPDDILKSLFAQLVDRNLVTNAGANRDGMLAHLRSWQLDLDGNLAFTDESAAESGVSCDHVVLDQLPVPTGLAKTAANPTGVAGTGIRSSSRARPAPRRRPWLVAAAAIILLAIGVGYGIVVRSRAERAVVNDRSQDHGFEQKLSDLSTGVEEADPLSVPSTDDKSSKELSLLGQSPADDKGEELLGQVSIDAPDQQDIGSWIQNDMIGMPGAGKLQPDMPLGSDAAGEVSEDKVAGLHSMSFEESTEPRGEPQKTRSDPLPREGHVRLPSREDMETQVLLFDHAEVEEMSLEFPHKVGLSLESGSSRVLDDRDVEVARIIKSDEGFLLRWSPGHRNSPAAKLLHQGLVATSDGGRYLRPIIDSPALAFNLAKADSRPTWDLLGPVPSSVTLLSVEIELPGKLEVGWIGPVNAVRANRSMGTAVIQSIDDDSVALGLRMDFRCATSLSCRLRYAAKLDSQMPWSSVSKPQLEQLSKQVADAFDSQMRIVRALQKRHESADTDSRRELRPMKEFAESRAESLQLYLKRMQQLRALIAHFESGAKLHLRLWVNWPSGEQQTILRVGADH